MKSKDDPFEPTALILEIQRMSTEDGPGIRTTVFFKGCPLRCAWCHNPESFSSKPQVHWIGSRCIGCHTCVEACPLQAVTFTPEGGQIDRTICNGCGRCAEACPSTALELLGRTWRLDELIQEVVKDRAFFEKSGGGITVSGGEPTLQSHFVGLFLKGLRGLSIQTALDTCGLCSTETLEELLPYVNILLFDIKVMDPVRHRALTGSDNALILENLQFVGEYMGTHSLPQTLWIRTPVIPDATGDKANIGRIGRFMADRLGHAVKRWDLCTFNNLCADKYQRLGMRWPFAHTPLIHKAEIEALTAVAKASGIDPSIVYWSGATRLESESSLSGKPA